MVHGALGVLWSLCCNNFVCSSSFSFFQASFVPCVPSGYFKLILCTGNTFFVFLSCIPPGRLLQSDWIFHLSKVKVYSVLRSCLYTNTFTLHTNKSTVAWMSRQKLSPPPHTHTNTFLLCGFGWFVCLSCSFQPTSPHREMIHTTDRETPNLWAAVLILSGFSNSAHWQI